MEIESNTHSSNRFRLPAGYSSKLTNQELEKMEPKRLIHELRTQQIELEMQNQELRETELKLRESNKRYIDLYDFAPAGYFTMSYRGVILKANLKASSLLGCERIRLIGALFREFLLTEDREIFEIHRRTVLASSGLIACDLRIRSCGDELRYIQMQSESWKDEAGKPCFRSILQDITERKLIENALLEAKDRAERANESKSQFLANMSHEMRTPLGVMLGFTEILQAISVTAQESPDMLKTIYRNGQHLLTLIDDILDLAKVEANQLKTSFLLMDVRKEVNEVLSYFREKVKEKEVGIKAEFSVSTPETLFSDPVRFRQILINIVGNAVKFTDAGSVRIGLNAVNTGRYEFLQIDVSDTGCGIPKDKQDLLFKPFSQVDGSFSRQFMGTGLGLCLSRRLAELLGGTVELLESEMGEGSTFRISLRIAKSRSLPGKNALVRPGYFKLDAKEDSAALDGELRDYRVLLVEDGADNRSLFRKILEAAEGRVTCVEDGESAVNCASSEEFDIILMDLQLPILDGYAATKALRMHGLKTPIVALTAHAQDAERLKTAASGFDAHIVKPVELHELIDIIKSLAKPKVRTLPKPQSNKERTGTHPEA